MKKEFGKWLLDVAKYVATVVILSTIFSDIQEKSSIYIVGIICVGLALLWGLYLVKEPENKSKKRKK